MRRAHIDAEVVDYAPAVEMVHELNSCNISRRYEDMETGKRSNGSKQNGHRRVIHNRTEGADEHVLLWGSQHGLQPRPEGPARRHNNSVLFE